MPTLPKETPPVAIPPPTAWDMIPDLFKALIVKEGEGLHPLQFSMVLGFIRLLRESRAFEPRRHNPTSAKVLETWLRVTLLTLNPEQSLESLRLLLLRKLQALVPKVPENAPVPASPGMSSPGTPAPAPIVPTIPRDVSVIPFVYSVTLEVFGTESFTRTDTLPCEGQVTVADMAGMDEDAIRQSLFDHAAENYNDDDNGDRQYGDADHNDFHDDEERRENIHIDNLDDIIAAVREYERSHV